MTWINGPLLGFDTETTGVSPENDRIVTAALITSDGEATETRTWLIDPGVPIPERASEVHGISTEHAREHGVQPRGALDEIAALLVQSLQAGTPVVGFNVAYDLNILENELKRNGLPTLAERLGGPSYVSPIIDPLVLDRQIDPYRRGKRKLIDVCAHYGVAVDAAELHAADADVLATLALARAIGRSSSTLAELSLGDLHARQIEGHRAWAENFADWLRRQGRTEDLPNPQWPLH